MEYNIVTNYRINQIFKAKSQFYRVNLGLASSQDLNSGKQMSQKDAFAFFYNQRYRTTIYGQGNIGNIKFYTDYYIKEDKLAFYFDREEFVFDFDEKMVKEKGADFYLGYLIKEIETQHEDRLKEKEEKVEQQKKVVGDHTKIFTNPGNVSYADLKAYLENKRKNRLSS